MQPQRNGGDKLNFFKISSVIYIGENCEKFSYKDVYEYPMLIVYKKIKKWKLLDFKGYPQFIDVYRYHTPLLVILIC